MAQSERNVEVAVKPHAPFHHHLAPLSQHRGLRKRIGILGGSFNPAHDGHLGISIAAKKAAGLDEVWWLVSPQNPLKDKTDMAPLSQRLNLARKNYTKSWLRILNFEEKYRLQLTIDTLHRLKAALPYCHFVWIMGADNLIQFPFWYQPEKLARHCSIMVINRPSYGYQALASKGAFILQRRRRKRNPRRLNRYFPAWSFVAHPRHDISATQIRNSAN